jgi:hypothetical protein
MAGPWEKYAATEQGPWTAYAKAANAPPPMVQEISGGVTDALKSAGSAVADYLNPFSDARHESYKRQAEARTFMGGMTESLSRLGDTGAAMATPVTAPANVAGAALTPAVAHPFYYLNQAVGTDIPYSQAKEQAATALSAARPAGYGPTGPIMQKPPTPTGADLKKAAVDVYTDPAVKAIRIPQSDAAALAAKIETDLTSAGFRPTAGNAPATLTEVQRMTPPAGASVGVDDLRAARRALNITAKQVGPDFKATPDAAAAKRAISEIDNFLDTLDPRLRTANANYAAGKSADMIDYRKVMADRRASKTGSGSNIENTLRQEVDKIPSRGLSPAAQALREKIVTGDVTRNVLRKVGKLGVSDGLSLLLHAGAAPTTGGLSVPVAVGGTAARKIGELLTRSQIKQLSDMIRSAAPAAQGRPMVAPQAPGVQQIISAMLGKGGQSPLIPMIPSYAEQDKRKVKP